ncbi:hypothetical protein HDG32_004744 [Paraburkholderia sp. CI2]|nr:hypothetical protein [Paraburkholderia sp. CI2]
MADAFNNHGIGSDGSSDTDGLGADFDGSLFSYSSQALTAAGAAPGKPFSFNGASFVLSGGPLDNAVAVGQTIAMPPGKLVTSITLPKQVSAGKLHVFGISAAP